jgi:hypothetical protein
MAFFNSTDSFENMLQLRKKLRLYSLLHNSPYYLKYSQPERLDARCPSTHPSQTVQQPACGFRLTAYKQAEGTIRLRRLELQHSAFCTATTSASGAALQELAAPFVANFNRIRPQDLLNVLRSEHGGSSTYSTAWRALSQGKKERTLEDDRSFMHLEGYLRTIIANNLGTVASLEHATDGTFRRVFLCPRPAQLAFKHGEFSKKVFVKIDILKIKDFNSR